MNPRARIAHERRRQMQVRKALEAALRRNGRRFPADEAAFYQAAGDYLVWSMDRLHEQDQRIHDLLLERLPREDASTRQALAALGRRQTRSRRMLARLRAAAERLRREGDAGVRAFETEARQFTNLFRALMAPRRNPFERHTQRLFREPDWEAVAWAGETTLAEETGLFEWVRLHAPEGCDPRTFSAEHLPG